MSLGRALAIVAAGMVMVAAAGCVDAPMVIGVYDASTGKPIPDAFVSIRTHSYMPLGGGCRSPSIGGDSQSGRTDEHGLVTLYWPNRIGSDTEVRVDVMEELSEAGGWKHQSEWLNGPWTPAKDAGVVAAEQRRAASPGEKVDVALELQPPPGWVWQPPALSTVKQVRARLAEGGPSVVLSTLQGHGATVESQGRENVGGEMVLVYRLLLASGERCTVTGNERGALWRLVEPRYDVPAR